MQVAHRLLLGISATTEFKPFLGDVDLAKKLYEIVS